MQQTSSRWPLVSLFAGIRKMLNFLNQLLLWKLNWTGDFLLQITRSRLGLEVSCWLSLNLRSQPDISMIMVGTVHVYRNPWKYSHIFKLSVSEKKQVVFVTLPSCASMQHWEKDVILRKNLRENNRCSLLSAGVKGVIFYTLLIFFTQMQWLWSGFSSTLGWPMISKST